MTPRSTPWVSDPGPDGGESDATGVALAPCTGRSSDADDDDVRPMRAEDRAEVLAVAARAFWSDPLFDFFARDLMHEYEFLPVVMNAYLKELENQPGEHRVGEVDGRPRAFAGWVAPDGIDRSPAAEARRTPRMIPPSRGPSTPSRRSDCSSRSTSGTPGNRIGTCRCWSLTPAPRGRGSAPGSSPRCTAGRRFRYTFRGTRSGRCAGGSVAPGGGLEPPTFGSKGRRSAN